MNEGFCPYCDLPLDSGRPTNGMHTECAELYEKELTDAFVADLEQAQLAFDTEYFGRLQGATANSLPAHV